MTPLVLHVQSQPALSAYVAEGLARVERRFARQLETPIPPVAQLVEHVERYRGKMLRPTLALLCAKAADPGQLGLTDEQVTVATVVEMIHMATLVHDDVLDESDLRRGGETVNKRRGNEAAVILGDYLISKSFHLCSQLDDQRTALRVGEITSIVCEGEMLQNHHRGDFAVTRAQHFDIIERKTGALIALACELGALQAGASNQIASMFFEFGELLGAAFQIQDDVLDLTGSEQVVGKNLGRDLQKGTLTLPVIHHLASLTEDERAATIEQIRGGAALNGHRASFVARLEQTGSVQHARDTAHELVDKAKSLLLSLPDSPAREMLLAMAEAVVSRAY